jgi:hypothetical protein
LTRLVLQGLLFRIAWGGLGYGGRLLVVRFEPLQIYEEMPLVERKPLLSCFEQKTLAKIEKESLQHGLRWRLPGLTRNSWFSPQALETPKGRALSRGLGIWRPAALVGTSHG